MWHRHICSKNLECLPLGDRAVAWETPPWENQPWLITGGGQARDVFFFLAIPWGQVPPLDLKESGKHTHKHSYLTPPDPTQSLSVDVSLLWDVSFAYFLQHSPFQFAGPSLLSVSLTHSPR